MMKFIGVPAFWLGVILTLFVAGSYFGMGVLSRAMREKAAQLELETTEMKRELPLGEYLISRHLEHELKVCHGIESAKGIPERTLEECVRQHEDGIKLMEQVISERDY